MRRRLAKLLLGRPLAEGEARGERVGAILGVAVLGLDALASAAYGPEAILTTLRSSGGAGARLLLPITAAIAFVLVFVVLSYRETIEAYPGGASSYTVARANLGQRASVLAAAALALDYVLNVAVAIAAGVGALVSALPRLLPFTLPICLGVLALLTLLNLRGVRAAGTLLALPTYAFVLLLFVVLAIGLGHAPAPPAPAFGAEVAPWLVARGFANGCTAI